MPFKFSLHQITTSKPENVSDIFQVSWGVVYQTRNSHALKTEMSNLSVRALEASSFHIILLWEKKKKITTYPSPELSQTDPDSSHLRIDSVAAVWAQMRVRKLLSLSSDINKEWQRLQLKICGWLFPLCSHAQLLEISPPSLILSFLFYYIICSRVLFTVSFFFSCSYELFLYTCSMCRQWVLVGNGSVGAVCVKIT